MITSKQESKGRRPGPEDALYYAGRSFTVIWYRTPEGRLPGLEYYKLMGEPDRIRLDRQVMLLADSPRGTILPRTIYRLEDAAHQIYAFKPGSERMFCFMYVGRKVIVTNGYRKHASRMTGKDLRALQVAIRARKEYLLRAGERSHDADA